MKKRIALPTDFSKNAWNACAYAFELFKDEECIFYIVNAYEVKSYALGDMMVPEPGQEGYERAAQISSNGLHKILDMIDFRNENSKHSFETISELNSPMEALKQLIEKKDIDMVVMGTKGATNSRAAILGSNAVMAMEHIRNCPVLAVPAEAQFEGVKEIVFPTSFKTHYKRRELEYLTDIAQHHNATIAVVHVDKDEELSSSQEENKELLLDRLEGVEVAFHHLRGSNPTDAVFHFVESRKSDLIAFVNKKHLFFGSIFTNPMVKELGMYSKVPLLALHDLRN
ncbi:universal stress protein [Croceiramulus getboli]|nr:universal stress protein [Flavobacteriaceae bacterium YJPT1-3]